jgi:hypothetical protein
VAKLKRQQVGSFCKSKDEKNPPYFKMRDGKIYRVESKKYQLKSLEDAVAAGKLGGDVADSIRERIEKIPEWVLAEIVELVPNTDQ